MSASDKNKKPDKPRADPSNGSEQTSEDRAIEQVFALGEITGSLQSLSDLLKDSARRNVEVDPNNPAQSALGQLIQVNQQLDAKTRGESHLSVVTDRADGLKSAAIHDMRRGLGLLEAGGGTDGDRLIEGRSLSNNSGSAVVAPSIRHIDADLHKPLSVDDDWLAEADGDDDWLDEADEDRRTVERPASDKPFFSKVARDYLRRRAQAKGPNALKDIRTAEWRIKVFLALIGDHPIDTYTGADLQAYVNKLRYWPKDPKHRPEGLSPEEIIESNRDLRFEPAAKATLRDGYLAVVKPVIGLGAQRYQFPNPIAGLQLTFPDTARASRPVEPLGVSKINAVFKAGVESGFLDLAMLPLLGHLTGRRLGLLTFLRGSDIREKYEGVWVADTSGVLFKDEKWQRIGYKTDASLRYYVLHDVLREIGFIDWARSQGDAFLFSELTRLARPTNSASTYLKRLFRRAGIEPDTREVFHSLRSNKIAELQDNPAIDSKTARLQAGHSLGDDEHTLYGWKFISEPRAKQLAHLPLDEDIDFSLFNGLDFAKLAAKKRQSGKRWQTD